MVLKENQVLRCPICGKMRFSTTFQMEEHWDINESMQLVDKSTCTCTRILKHPDENTLCACVHCNYEAPLKEFVYNLFVDAAFTNCTNAGGLTKKQQDELLDCLHPSDKVLVPYSLLQDGVLFCGFISDDCFERLGEIGNLLFRLNDDKELHNEQGVYDVDGLRIKLL